MKPNKALANAPDATKEDKFYALRQSSFMRENPAECAKLYAWAIARNAVAKAMAPFPLNI